MAITKVINDAVNLNQTSDYSGLKLPVGTTEQQGISFNLDPHYKSGSHWVSLYVHIPKKIIYYFDSNGDKTPKEIKKLIVVTRGENGAIAIKDDQVVECDAEKNLKIVDLTGAGDLFAAGFLHGYVNNLSLKDSLEKGTDLSSKIIQQVGARL